MKLVFKTILMFVILLSFAQFAFADKCSDKLNPEVVLPVVPTFATSFSEKYTDLLKKIDDLEAEYHSKILKLGQLKETGGAIFTSNSKYLADSVQGINRYRNFFEKIRESGIEDLKFVELIDTSFETIHDKQKSVHWLAKNLSNPKVFHDDGFNILYNVYAKLLGDLAETRLALTVPEFVAKSKGFVEVINTFVPENRRAEVLEYLKTKNVAGEVDLIFKSESGKTVWCEVKNLQKHLSNSNGSKRIEEQLRKILKFRDKVDPNIEVRLYVFRGMTKRAREKYQKMGVVVY